MRSCVALKMVYLSLFFSLTCSPLFSLSLLLSLLYPLSLSLLLSFISLSLALLYSFPLPLPLSFYLTHLFSFIFSISFPILSSPTSSSSSSLTTSLSPSPSRTLLPSPLQAVTQPPRSWWWPARHGCSPQRLFSQLFPPFTLSEPEMPDLSLSFSLCLILASTLLVTV